jgi:alanine racemase
MVKADAYGLGAVRVSRALEALDTWGFGVATVEEGMELREAGIRRPVLVLTPTGLEYLEDYRRHDLRAVLDDPAGAERWDLPYHVEVDTGMGRCGVRWDDTDRLAAFPSRHLEGVFTHFYAADQGRDTVAKQWTRFESALEALASRPQLVHVANSAGVWRLERQLDLARPGIFLYGGRHAPDLPPPHPVAALRAPVVSIRRLQAGETVSYGGEWAAPRETVVATLGIGYADGVPRAVKGRAEVLLRGERRPLVGRVTMDFVMVDVGPDGSGVTVGDVATLIGRDGEGEITVDEFAGWSGTIAYETLTGIGRRVPRVFLPE